MLCISPGDWICLLKEALKLLLRFSWNVTNESCPVCPAEPVGQYLFQHQPYAPACSKLLMRAVNHWVYTITAKSQVALWQCRFNDKNWLVQSSPVENVWLLWYWFSEPATWTTNGWTDGTVRATQVSSGVGYLVVCFEDKVLSVTFGRCLRFLGPFSESCIGQFTMLSPSHPCQGRSVFVCTGTTRTMADSTWKVSRAAIETHQSDSLTPLSKSVWWCLIQTVWKKIGLLMSTILIFWLSIFKLFLVPTYPVMVVWQCCCLFHTRMTYSPTYGFVAWFSCRYTHIYRCLTKWHAVAHTRYQPSECYQSLGLVDS